MMMTIVYVVCWLVSVGLMVAISVHYRTLYRATENISKAAFYDDLDHLIAKLEGDKVRLQERLEALRESAETAKMDAEAAQRLKLAEERELETIRSEIMRIREQVRQLEPEREELRRTRENLDRNRSELEDVQRRHADLMAGLGKAQAEMASVLTRRDEAMRDLKQCDDRLPQMKAEVATLEMRTRELRATASQLEEHLAALESRKESAEAAIRQLEMRRAELEGKNAILAERLETAEKGIKDREAIIRKLGQELAELEGELRNRRSEKDQIQTNLDALRNELAALQDQKAATEKRLADVEKQLEEARKRLEEAKRQATVQEGKAQEAALTAETLKKLIEEYQKLLKSLMETAGQHGGHVEQLLHESLRDLTQPVNLALNLKSGREADSEQTCLQNLRQRLDSVGLHFHPRVLAAFHTSLKTSSFNQLTVLAGVSGTGKSALPRAYAEAMGIHSLVVPVQPGWAGPQDLLGFFNYLERKYKATELSRYLALFSQYAAQDLAALEYQLAGSRKDEVLLVLLDEMNLARVEYYFSEFLSRLEMRSAIDAANVQQRRSVAIPLETGPMKEGTLRPTLYPDSNILFVGTMNEDESTQALSEKVIDRANVLRFGAPPQGSFEQKKRQPTGAPAPVTTALPRTAWEQWCDERRPGIDPRARLQEFDKDIPELCEVMDQLGRPFGYRVHEAMRRYLIAYPRLGSSTEVECARHAFADQIEQKIIPKLRGIDTEDRARELGRLEQVLQRLGDQPLSKAFALAKARPTFEWSGLKRDQGM